MIQSIAAYTFWLIRHIFLNFLSHKLPSMAAAISFYAIISIAPILVLIVAIIGIYYGDAASQGLIVDELGEIIGTDGAILLQNLLVNAQLPQANILKTIIGASMFLFAATAMFNEFQNSLNRIWDIPDNKRRSWINFLRMRFMSLILIISISVLVLASIILTTLVSTLSNSLSGYIPLQYFDSVFYALQEISSILSIVSISITTGLFLLVYQILPDIRNKWSDTLIGAIIAAFLFHLLKKGIAQYIGSSVVVSYYGAAGVLIAILLWIYFSTLIILLGALITRAVHDARIEKSLT